MAVGYSAKGQCFDTAQKALDLYYSGAAPTALITPTGSLYTQHFVKPLNDWRMHLNNEQFFGSQLIADLPAPVDVIGTCTYVPVEVIEPSAFAVIPTQDILFSAFFILVFILGIGQGLKT